MNTLLKRFLFVMIAATLLRAGPAMSVPLATTSGDDALTSQQGTTDPDGQYSPFRRVGGSDGNDAEVRIVSSDVLAYGPQPDNAEMASHPSYGANGQAAMSSGVARSGKSPGWIKPVAAIGAGSSLYALFGKKHGKGGSDKGGLGDGGFGNGGGGGGGNGGGGLGDDTPGPGDDLPGDIPSEVPEPGTMLLMGIGIAGYLGRRKIMKK